MAQQARNVVSGERFSRSSVVWFHAQGARERSPVVLVFIRVCHMFMVTIAQEMQGEKTAQRNYYGTTLRRQNDASVKSAAYRWYGLQNPGV
jgi:hypothetical protein